LNIVLDTVTLLHYISGVLHNCIRCPMTRRSSVRALAREIYRDLVEVEEAAPAARPGGSGEKKETELTTRVRALYEQKAVPVREIAAMAGVTERTIYKYVARYGWKRRYLVMPRGWATVPDREPRITPPRGAAQAKARIKRRARDRMLEPVKGAGGRFIRREDRHKPFASGLRATDPDGASRAVGRGDKAARLAAEALASAEFTRCSEASVRALSFAAGAFEKHVNYRTKHGIEGNRPRGVDVVDDALRLTSEMAWEALDVAAKERQAAFEAWMALPNE
jgi:hypothetical protein